MKLNRKLVLICRGKAIRSGEEINGHIPLLVRVVEYILYKNKFSSSYK